MIERSLFAEPSDSTNKNINSKHSLPRGRSHDLTQKHHPIQTQSFSAWTLRLRCLPVFSRDNSLLMTQMSVCFRLFWLQNLHRMEKRSHSRLGTTVCVSTKCCCFFPVLLRDRQKKTLAGQDPTPKKNWSELSQTAVHTARSCKWEPAEVLQEKAEGTPTLRPLHPPPPFSLRLQTYRKLWTRQHKGWRLRGVLRKRSTKWWSQLSWDSSAGGNGELRIWTAV